MKILLFFVRLIIVLCTAYIAGIISIHLMLLGEENFPSIFLNDIGKHALAIIASLNILILLLLSRKIKFFQNISEVVAFSFIFSVICYWAVIDFVIINKITDNYSIDIIQFIMESPFTMFYLFQFILLLFLVFLFSYILFRDMFHKRESINNSLDSEDCG